MTRKAFNDGSEFKVFDQGADRPAWLAGAGDLPQRLVSWRRHLHRHPELSFQEFATTRFIVEKLAAMDVTVERPTPTGAVAVIQGQGPGPTIAVRADIDALPIHEENTFEFRSQRPGVMHACGHDGHTAMGLGVAETLARHRKDWPGRVKLLFQPAEETAPGGAQAFIAAGVLDDVDAIVGIHLSASMDLGLAGIRPGGMLANTGWFEVKIKGRGDLPGFPQRSADAVVAAAHAVVKIQSVVSRQVDPVQPAIVNVRQLEAGSARHYFIADRAVLAGTISTFDDDLQEDLVAKIRQVVQQSSSQFGAQADFAYYPGLPALINDPHLAAVLDRSARAVLGDDAVRGQPPVLAADDFTYYAREVPGGYFFLGAGDPAVKKRAPHHHPRFDFDERALPSGVHILNRAVYQLLTDSGGEHLW